MHQLLWGMFLKIQSKRAFTLIEVLVVIAIIGVLAAIILLNVSGARIQARDTAIKANLTNISGAIGTYASNHQDSFGTVDDGSGGAVTCPLPGDSSGTGVFYDPAIEEDIATALSNAGVGGLSWCVSSSDSYAVSLSRPVEVIPNKSYYWCVDSAANKCGNNGDQDLAPDPAHPPIMGGQCVACTSSD